MPVALVVVSHSARLAEGVVELAGQMTHGAIQLIAAGGTDDGSLGTSLNKVLAAIRAVDSPDGVLLLVDLGSAGLIAELAREQLDEDSRGRVMVSRAPLVEGAVLAAVEASIGSPLADVMATAERAMAMEKLATRG